MYKCVTITVHFSKWVCVTCGEYTEGELQVMLSLPAYLMYYMLDISGWHITPYSKTYFLILGKNKCEQKLLKMFWVLR